MVLVVGGGGRSEEVKVRARSNSYSIQDPFGIKGGSRRETGEKKGGN